MTDATQVLGRIKSALARIVDSIGWRSTAGEDRNQFYCEFCSAHSDNWRKIPHLEHCAVLEAREALRLLDGLGEVDEGGEYLFYHCTGHHYENVPSFWEVLRKNQVKTVAWFFSERDAQDFCARRNASPAPPALKDADRAPEEAGEGLFGMTAAPTPTPYSVLADELTALGEKATPGPWFQWPTKDGGRVCAPFPVEGEEPLSIADFDMDTRIDYDTQSCANAALTASLKRNLATLTAALREAARLREALVHIEEYWNGSRTDGAMSDALDEILSTARASLKEPGHG